jgi:hypothetical protein
VNPWGATNVVVRKAAPGGATVMMGAGATLTFATEKNGVYVIERANKPLSGYAYSVVTGPGPNQGVKRLATNTTLGSGGGAPVADTGKYEAEAATLTDCSVSDDISASNFAEVTNLRMGSSVTFANVRAGTAIDVRYCTMNNPGRLGLYINGTRVSEVTFPSTMSWSGTYTTLTIGQAVPQGASIKLQYDAGGSGANLDYIQIK